MSLLRDRFEHGVRAALTPAERAIYEQVLKATVFRIDNVAEYFWRSDQEYWDVAVDFPNLAPPFPAMWMEYPYPTIVVSRERGRTLMPQETHGRRKGVLLLAYEDAPFPDCRWMVIIRQFESVGEDGVAMLSNPIAMGVTTDGRLAHRPDGQPIFDFQLEPGQTPESISEETRSYLMATATSIKPALLAISFLHCKNVEMIEQLPASARVSPVTGKKMRNRHGAQTKHYVLAIEPMKRVLRHEGAEGTQGLKHSLHVCRGHFKSFDKGGGLFGKYHGTYWWGSQVRGRASTGTIDKDYSVNPPAPDQD